MYKSYITYLQHILDECLYGAFRHKGRYADGAIPA